MKKLLPILFLILGGAAGAGAGMFFMPAPTEEKAEESEGKKQDKAADHDPKTSEYVKLENQFVVPVIEDGDVVSLVVLALSLETVPGMKEEIYKREPKLRDLFLQTLFDHSNLGGFSGSFTSAGNMRTLRMLLLEIAQEHVGDGVIEVLIQDIARQDI